MLYAGIDIHKQHCQICIKDQQGTPVRAGRVNSTPKDVTQFFDYLPDPQLSIVVEACGIKDNIIDTLRTRGYHVDLSNPFKNRLIAEAKTKTDKIDAECLCDLLRSNMISTVYYPTYDIRELKSLIRQREHYTQEKTRCINRLKRIILRNGMALPKGPLSTIGKKILQRDDYPSARCAHQLLDTINHLDTQISTLEKNIGEESTKYPELKKIDTIFGFGPVNSAAIWSEIATITRFPTPQKLVSYAGLNPSIYQSGETERRGHITKQGSTILRTALIRSAWIHIRKDDKISRFFLKLTKRGKPKPVAATACARKLLVSIYFMLKPNQPFIA